MNTTIQIKKDTLNRLKEHKRFARESYDGVLNTILDDLEEETLSDEEVSDIKESLDQVSKGNVYSIEEVAEELGIKL